MKTTRILVLLTALLFLGNSQCNCLLAVLYVYDVYQEIFTPPSDSSQLVADQVCAAPQNAQQSTMQQIYDAGNKAFGTHFTPSQNFNSNQSGCPDTTNSPQQPNSNAAIPKPNTQQFLALHSDPKAATPATAAYLPRLLLNLPFPARASAGDSPSYTCDTFQRDILQVNHDNAAVNRISTCPLAAVATIPVVTRPLQIAISPDGSSALVTSFDNAISFIDLSSNRVTFTLSTGAGIYPNGIAITPDGTKAYVTNFLPQAASLVEYDLTTNRQILSMPTPAYPQSAFLSPDGSQLFVTFPYGNQVWIVDTLTNSLAFTIQVQGPRSVVFNSKGTNAYISSTDNPDLSVSPGKVQQFDTATFQIEKAYNVGVGPADMVILYGDQYVVVNNFEGQSISRIDTISGAIETITVKGRPNGLVIVR